jgi:hypothetical protein
MDTGYVLCDIKTDSLYVLNYSDEFLAPNFRTIWLSKCNGHVDQLELCVFVENVLWDIVFEGT